MNYLISGEELIKHLKKEYKELLDINYLKNVIEVFFKSQQPVELLAEGEVNLQGDYIYVGKKDLWQYFFERKKSYENIKLFIEVSK